MHLKIDRQLDKKQLFPTCFQLTNELTNKKLLVEIQCPRDLLRIVRLVHNAYLHTSLNLFEQSQMHYVAYSNRVDKVELFVVVVVQRGGLTIQ